MIGVFISHIFYFINEKTKHKSWYSLKHQIFQRGFIFVLKKEAKKGFGGGGGGGGGIKTEVLDNIIFW